MKEKFLILFVLLLTCVGLRAQTVTVTGSALQASTGGLLPKGRIQFQPMYNGKPASYNVNGGGQLTNEPVSASVANGALTLSLVDSRQTIPANACYKVTVFDQWSRVVLGSIQGVSSGYDCVQMDASWCTGSICNFDQYVPTFKPLPQQGPPGPKGDKGDAGPTGPTGGVSSFASRNGAVLPLVSDYAAFYSAIGHTHTKSQIMDWPSVFPSDWSLIANKPNFTQTKVCTGTDKLSSYNALTGLFTCDTDQNTGTVGGPSLTTIYLNVKDTPYNCKGDGSTDDTSCIQSAIDTAEASIGTLGIRGATIFFPQGRYVAGCSAPIRVHKDGMTLMGVSKSGSFVGPLNGCGGANGTWLIFAETASSLQSAGINFQANALVGTGKALQVTDVDSAELHIDLRSGNATAELDGLGAFTAEAVIKPSQITGSTQLVMKSAGARDSVAPNNEAFEISFNSVGALSCKLNLGGVLFTVTSPNGTVVANVAKHVALSYDGSTLKCFVNGTSVGTPQTVSGTIRQDLTEGVFLGCDPSGNFPNRCSTDSRSMTGAWDNVRLSKVARYTANFTPPSAKFTSADSNTLIACPFSTQWDTATECIVPGSGNSAKVWVNTDRNYCPGNWHATDVDHLGLMGGIFVNNGSGVKFQDVGVGGDGIAQYGLNISGTCNFEIHLEDMWFQGNTGRYALNVGTGIARLENLSVNGARYGLISQSNVTIDDLFIGSFSNSIVPVIVRGQPGISNYVNLRNMQWDGEFSAPNYVANLILDNVDQAKIATSWIGSSAGPSTAVPVIVNSYPWTGAISFEENFFSAAPNQGMLVKYNTIGAVNQLRKNTTVPLQFVGNTQSFVVPWTNAPNARILGASFSGWGQAPLSTTLNNDPTFGAFPATPAQVDANGNVVTAAPGASSVDGIVVPFTSTSWQFNYYGQGKTGTSELATAGSVFCAFDGPVTAGHFVGISSTTRGCTDVGTSPPAGQTLGRAVESKAIIPINANPPYAQMNSGGTLTPGVYSYCVTYITTAGGETPCSVDRTYTIVAPNQTLDILPPSLYDDISVYEEAAGWRIYLTSAGGSTKTLQPANSTTCGSAQGIANSPLSGCNFSTHAIFAAYTAAGAVPPVTNNAGRWAKVLMRPSGSGGGTQPDWTQSNPAAADFIKNKPSIPAGPPYTEAQVTGLVADLAGKNPSLVGQSCTGTDKVSGFNGSGLPVCGTDQTGGSSATAAAFQATTFGSAVAPNFQWDEGASGKSGLYYDSSNAGVVIGIRNNSYYHFNFNSMLPNGDNSIRIGDKDFFRWQSGSFIETYTQKVHMGVANSYACDILYGSGTPEGNVTAPHCSLYLRTDGGAGTSMYVKETGTGNTGWVAK